MGKASRRKRERRITVDRPRWAGAAGFDRSYKIAERYVEVCEKAEEAFGNSPPVPPGMPDPADTVAFRVWADRAEDRAQALGYAQSRLAHFESVAQLLEFKVDLSERKIAALRAFAEGQGLADEDDPKDPLVLPGRPMDSDLNDLLPYALSLGTLARDHLAYLREAVPIVFDPLSVPEPSIDSTIGFGSPFPAVVADFLTPGGMSLPVVTVSGQWWVGLVAATVVQGEEGGPIDVWPTVNTLRSDRANDRQAPRELMFGRVRFGGPLPPAPEGLALVETDDAAAWVVGVDKPEMWTEIWLVLPALAALSALRLLDAVNVTLIDKPLSRPERRRAEREQAKPALMVDVTTGRSTGGAGTAENPAHIDWSHRWMVRGHWKHFGEQTAVARRHPSRVMDVPGHGRCVKVWCPPFVKGPEDKPLVLKTRVVANEGPLA